jgi:hypothetical protein
MVESLSRIRNLPNLALLRFDLARDQCGNASRRQLVRSSSEVDSGSEPAE